MASLLCRCIYSNVHQADLFKVPLKSGTFDRIFKTCLDHGRQKHTFLGLAMIASVIHDGVQLGTSTHTYSLPAHFTSQEHRPSEFPDVADSLSIPRPLCVQTHIKSLCKVLKLIAFFFGTSIVQGGAMLDLGGRE